MVNSVVEFRDPKLAEIVKRLVAALQPERVYLFGSRARGDAAEGSDYDVLVIVEEVAEQPYGLEQRAYRALSGLTTPVDVVVMSRKRFEGRLRVAASLPATVEREGKLLYAA